MNAPEVISAKPRWSKQKAHIAWRIAVPTPVALVRLPQPRAGLAGPRDQEVAARSRPGCRSAAVEPDAEVELPRRRGRSRRGCRQWYCAVLRASSPAGGVGPREEERHPVGRWMPPLGEGARARARSSSVRPRSSSGPATTARPAAAKMSAIVIASVCGATAGPRPRSCRSTQPGTAPVGKATAAAGLPGVPEAGAEPAPAQRVIVVDDRHPMMLGVVRPRPAARPPADDAPPTVAPPARPTADHATPCPGWRGPPRRRRRIARRGRRTAARRLRRQRSRDRRIVGRQWDAATRSIPARPTSSVTCASAGGDDPIARAGVGVVDGLRSRPAPPARTVPATALVLGIVAPADRATCVRRRRRPSWRPSCASDRRSRTVRGAHRGRQRYVGSCDRAAAAAPRLRARPPRRPSAGTTAGVELRHRCSPGDPVRSARRPVLGRIDEPIAAADRAQAESSSTNGRLRAEHGAVTRHPERRGSRGTRAR